MKALDLFLRKLDAVFLPPDELLRNLAGDDERADGSGLDAAAVSALTALLRELGGEDRVASVSCVGLTRVRFALHEAIDGRRRAAVQEQAVRYGADAVMWCSESVVHLIAGARAPALADAALAKLARSGRTKAVAAAAV